MANVVDMTCSAGPLAFQRVAGSQGMDTAPPPERAEQKVNVEDVMLPLSVLIAPPDPAGAEHAVNDEFTIATAGA